MTYQLELGQEADRGLLDAGGGRADNMQGGALGGAGSLEGLVIRVHLQGRGAHVSDCGCHSPALEDGCYAWPTEEEEKSNQLHVVYITRANSALVVSSLGGGH